MRYMCISRGTYVDAGHVNKSWHICKRVMRHMSHDSMSHDSMSHTHVP